MRPSRRTRGFIVTLDSLLSPVRFLIGTFLTTFEMHSRSALLSRFLRPASRCFSSSSPVTPVTVTQSPKSLEALRARLANESPSLTDFIHGDTYSVEVGTKKKPLPKPKWMKESIPGGERYVQIKKKLRDLKLHTVCEEAKCPNLGECWSGGETGTATATIMILGDTCTRGCRYHLSPLLFIRSFPILGHRIAQLDSLFSLKGLLF